MDVGTTLRQAREQRALSVEDLARITKITTANLTAVEQNRRDDLPGDVYVRGFVRAYAREVGLDPDDTARRYLDQFKPPPEAIPAAERPGAGTPRLQATAYIQALAEGRHGLRDHWITAAILVVIALGYSLVFTHPWSSIPAWRGAPANAVTATTRPATQSVPTASRTEVAATTGTQQATAVDVDLLRVDVRASKSCWVAATADGTRIVYELMQPDEQRTFDVRRDLVLRIGDPGAFTFAINGAPGRQVGRAGEPVTVTITRENYREFLQP